jgi:glycerol-3-phosphate dehydrogenase
MKRDIAQLSGKVYDVLIIGGGIYGAWAAWDAALRGLSVALVDKGDFGSATSSNTMKIIHGGLRYLQQADFRRMRESIRERTILMEVAPYLVHPIPFLMPTYGHFMKSKEIMSLALMINGIIGFDRNRLNDPQKCIPRGLVISKSECIRLFPGVNQKGLTGGAIWYDCQVYNSERMILSILRSAEKAGVALANYVEATGFLKDGNCVKGVKARDVLTNDEIDVRAKVVVNTSGPWVNDVLQLLNDNYKNPGILLSKAMNIVVNRQLIPKYAVGVSSPFKLKKGDSMVNKGSRLLFITPWREYSLIGTTYIPFNNNPNNLTITEADIQDFIDEANKAYPAASLKREDISFVHGGLLPMDSSSGGEVRLTKKYQIWDHAKFGGIEGLISVVGVKYTTARAVIEKAIDLVFKKLGKKTPRCLTHVARIHGGHIERFNDFLAQETRKRERGLDTEVIRHLVYNYGSEYPRVFKYIDDNSNWRQTLDRSSQVIKAEVVYGIREEMAQKLTDVVFRRTELGSAGNPGEIVLKTCAAIMAKELDWDEARIQSEIKEVKAVFSSGA